MNQKRIKKQKENFSDWYDSIVENAQLVQKSNIKGMFFIMPRAWAIWEQIQTFLNSKFAELKVQNVAFPSLISLKDFEKEKAHIAGFAPELFLVQAKNKLLANWALRPTSEILFCKYFQKILQTHNQLPLKLNQWCNVFRLEKNTKAFLRTAEFHWQELHSLHSIHSEASDFIQSIYQIYQTCLRDYLAIAFLTGSKTVNERFAGAETTFTLETFLPDGQMLQSCTCHDLTTNFSTAFDIKFTTTNNLQQHPFQTASGISTRILGAMIMNHADDSGLVLPFPVAPVQIAVLNLFKSHDAHTNNFVAKIETIIKNYRYEIDNSDKSFGFKIQNQELFGTPFVLLAGTKEIIKNEVVVIERISKQKTWVPISQLKSYLTTAILAYQTQLYEKSLQCLNANIVECSKWSEVLAVIACNKIALAPWFDQSANEAQLKATNCGFGPRCIQKKLPIESNLLCAFSNQKANCFVYFARSY